LRLSVIVPFHRNLTQLRQCLTAIKRARLSLSNPADADILVVADGAIDDPTDVAREAGANVLAIEGPLGPAVARSRGVARASGEVIVFVDTDVVVSEDALARFAALFLEEPDLGAAFGAYDEDPADPGFISQCRNLAHSFVHQLSCRDAQTFWAGLGAVRAEAFAAVGGFDERFSRPSVEDIELGYRLHAAGFRIRLDPSIQGKHLKRWTFRRSVVSDVRDRGIPWTQLLKRKGRMQNDLNVTVAYRACVVIAYLLALCLVGAIWRPELLALVALAAAALWFLDRAYYRFFVSRRGLAFALAWFPFHVLHHLCNGVSFAVGMLLYLGQRWAGIALPGALPLTPWRGAVAPGLADGNQRQSLARS